MSARHLFSSCARRRATGWGLAALLVAVGLGAALPAPSAWADSPAPTSSTGAVTKGVCEALGQLQSNIDYQGQEVVNEKMLEHARRTDAVAEQLRLDALNSKGEAAGAAAEAEAEAAREAQLAAERAAAEGASNLDQSSSVDATAPELPGPPTNIITFHGGSFPYVQGNPADMTAPSARVASTWLGDGNVNDGKNTYFIGHNPGIFAEVMNLQVGDEIVVWDATGSSRTYYVFDTLVLPNTANYFAYEDRLSPQGESVTLQTCIENSQDVRCVMAR